MVRVYINRHVVAANQKSGERNPPITIYRQGKREYALAVEIIGSSRVVYSPDRPLSCGARVWIEAEDARVDDAAFYERLAARTRAKPKQVPAPPKTKRVPAPLLAKANGAQSGLPSKLMALSHSKEQSIGGSD
jgi:hypothetical protein